MDPFDLADPTPIRELDQLDAYDRAIQAEPQLQPVVRLVDALVELRRPSDYLCVGCVWESIVKPLVSPWIGWGRGYAPEQAEDPDPDPVRRLRVVDAATLLTEMKENEVPATTETERWLRTSDAFDAFTNQLLAKLDQADPCNGHGIGRAKRGA